MEKLNPPVLLEPPGDSHVHVTIVPPGSRIAYFAGQVAFNKKGDLIGKGDLGKQAEQVYANIRDTLVAVGVGPESIAKLTIYVVNYRPEHFHVIDNAARTIFRDQKPVTAAAIIGVQALGLPDFLIEIEAVVELPGAAS